MFITSKTVVLFYFEHIDFALNWNFDCFIKTSFYKSTISELKSRTVYTTHCCAQSIWNFHVLNVTNHSLALSVIISSLSEVNRIFLKNWLPTILDLEEDGDLYSLCNYFLTILIFLSKYVWLILFGRYPYLKDDCSFGHSPIFRSQHKHSIWWSWRVHLIHLHTPERLDRTEDVLVGRWTLFHHDAGVNTAGRYSCLIITHFMRPSIVTSPVTSFEKPTSTWCDLSMLC